MNEQNDNIIELTELVRQLTQKIDTLEQHIAELETQVQKINFLSKLLDVEITNLTENDLLLYSSDGKWHNINYTTLLKDQEETTEIVKKLSELTDVLINSPVDNQVLAYSQSAGKWVNKDANFGGGGTGDLSGYLTKIEAQRTYFPLTGGTINGNVTIKGNLDTSTGNVRFNVNSTQVNVYGNMLSTGGITLYNEN